MASFNPRRFADPDFLKTIAERHILALLRPYAGYFARRGVELPSGERVLMAAEPVALYEGRPVRSEPANGVDYERLAGVLVDPDEEMPADLVDALYLINEMATPEGMEELIESAGYRIVLDESDEQTPADIATQVFINARHLLERKHAEQFVGERKSFERRSSATT